MNPLHRKILYIILWYLIYPQLWYIFIIPELLYDPTNVLSLTAILLSYIFGIVDTYFRPFSKSILNDVSTNPVYNIIILALFIFNPMLIIAAFNENRQFIASAFSIWDNPIISMLGIIILTIGGSVTVLGRARLLEYGSGVLSIENDHKLITTGILSYIRHPVYAGELMGIIGIYLSFRSIIMLFVVSTLYFIVIRHRLLFEEQLLLKKFGEKYSDYMKRTKRLFPFLY